MPSSEERYAKAAECTELVRKLWRSHPNEVLKGDNPDVIREMVKPIEHNGEYFKVKGPLNIPQHISGEMPLFQAVLQSLVGILLLLLLMQFLLQRQM